ncbi:hypothetical protein ACIGZJ_31075 [Kitasatospora sp. NPDC052868]|uniref:hypothetical protein n=1 Tax=Kitasatospora sp. NPDC052868 TaxID=3364060 RepID=UPI0037C5374E
MTNTTVTFDSLIASYGEDIAYLAAGLDGTPAGHDGLTPEAFTTLVQEAADELEAHAALRMYGEADDLAEAAARLRAALQIQAEHQNALLNLAAKLLPAATEAAREIRLAS